MQSISFYIAYLLTKHECVILPGLGAFVASGSEEWRDKKAGLLCPPGNFLGFNPDIRHNDGLLANTIANGNNISYREACLQMYQYIDRITGCMEKQMPVQMPWIGKLEFSAERKILFTPSSWLSCNVNIFGMNNFYMPSVQELINQEESPLRTDVEPLPAKPSIVRRSLAIAAVIIGLLMIAIPVNNQLMQPSQMAAMISLPVLTETKTETEAEVVQAVEEWIETEEWVEEITPYYIVIASCPTENSAHDQLKQFREKGFSTADIVSVGNKHRIYIAKFSDKTEANTFLARFRTEHSQYSDAWLLIQRI